MSIACDIARVCTHFQALLLLYLPMYIPTPSTESSDYCLFRLSASNVPAFVKALLQWSGFEIIVDKPIPQEQTAR